MGLISDKEDKASFNANDKAVIIDSEDGNKVKLLSLNNFKGDAGEDGTDGIDGTNGTNGLSAYELRINEGNTGTLQEFLSSLVGNDGNDGNDGDDGLSAYELRIQQGNSGNINDFLTSLKGEKGDTGNDGADGETFDYRGTYVYGASYDTGFVVFFGGSSYVSRIDGNTTVPTNASYRGIIAEKGADGEGSGDMLKLTYDTDNSGVVDNSERLGGELPSYYQEALVNQVNIKSINGLNVLGSGNLQITAGSGGYAGNVYFLNGASSIEPTYKELSYTPEESETILSAVANSSSGDVLLGQFLFGQELETTELPAGKWNFDFYGYVSSTAGTSVFKFTVYKRTSGGVETDLFTMSSLDVQYSSLTLIELLQTQSQYSVNFDDYLGVKVYVNTTSVSNITFYFTVGNGDASYFTTPLQIRHNQTRDRDAIDSHPATAISYDNTTSGLTSIDVQSVIDEINTNKAEIGTDNNFTSQQTFGDDVIITGNLTVNGTTTTVNSTTVTTADNIIVLNYGEAGAGVTSGSSGIEVDRGTATNYEFIFQESDDTFRIGEIGSLQAVATREDSPIDGGIAIWNDTNVLFETISVLPISKGGTGSSTRNFVDLTTTETITGAKTFSNNLIRGDTADTTGNYINIWSPTTITNQIDSYTNGVGFRDLLLNGGAITLKNTGNVGIGTSSPSQKLEVKDGHIKVNQSAEAGINLLQSSNEWFIKADGNSLLNIQEYNGAGSFVGNRVSIKQGGNVGIDNINPTEKLSINGRLFISDTTAPSTTTNKLYAVGGNLYWNGTQLN